MDITWLLVIVLLLAHGLWVKRQNTIYIRQLHKTSKASNDYMVSLARRSTDPAKVAELKKAYEQEREALLALEKKS